MRKPEDLQEGKFLKLFAERGLIVSLRKVSRVDEKCLARCDRIEGRGEGSLKLIGGKREEILFILCFRTHFFKIFFFRFIDNFFSKFCMFFFIKNRKNNSQKLVA